MHLKCTGFNFFSVGNFMNRDIYFRKVDVNKNSFFKIEKGSGMIWKCHGTDKIFFGMNFLVGVLC